VRDKHMFHSSDGLLTSVHLTAVCVPVSCSVLQLCVAVRTEHMFNSSEERLTAVCLAVSCSVLQQCVAVRTKCMVHLS